MAETIIQREAPDIEAMKLALMQAGIDLTKTVEAYVQINFIGTPIGVKEEGGLVQTVNTTITISTLPTNIPS